MKRQVAAPAHILYMGGRYVRFVHSKASGHKYKGEESVSVSGLAFLDHVADLLYEQRRRRFQVLTSTIRAFFGYCILSVNLNCLSTVWVCPHVRINQA